MPNSNKVKGVVRAEVLTQDTLNRAFKAMSENDGVIPLVWLDNENNYLHSEIVAAMGFRCTQEEIAAANKKEDGFIKQAKGVNLYLSSYKVYFPATPQPEKCGCGQLKSEHGSGYTGYCTPPFGDATPQVSEHKPDCTSRLHNQASCAYISGDTEVVCNGCARCNCGAVFQVSEWEAEKKTMESLPLNPPRGRKS